VSWTLSKQKLEDRFVSSGLYGQGENLGGGGGVEGFLLFVTRDSDSYQSSTFPRCTASRLATVKKS
jgi:hypothetical protein